MQPLAFSIAELVRIGPLSRSALYTQIGLGRLRAVKAGRRTILRVDYEHYLANFLRSARSSATSNESARGQ